MYSTLPHFVLGFHGCDESVAEKILSSDKHHLQKSENDYDWLGPGVYFWENNPERALDYARFLRDNPHRNASKTHIKHPAVIGTVIDPGNCLNLLEAKSIDSVKEGYQQLVTWHETAGIPLPENRPVKGKRGLLLRNLDCAVIRMVHYFNEKHESRGYDTVRGLFTEGKPLYPNAGFHEKNHIQICVCNLNCIKGYFHPRKPMQNFSLP